LKHNIPGSISADKLNKASLVRGACKLELERHVEEGAEPVKLNRGTKNAKNVEETEASKIPALHLSEEIFSFMRKFKTKDLSQHNKINIKMLKLSHKHNNSTQISGRKR